MIEEWIRKAGDIKKISLFQSKRGQYILVIIIGLGLLALMSPVGKVEKAGRLAEKTASYSSTETGIKEQLKNDVAEILSQIDGAGQVEVSITLVSDGLKKYASNMRDEKRETEEIDGRGTAKSSTEESLVQDLAISAGSPLLVEQKYPEVLGVLVVADGAGDPAVCESLTDAAATLLNISPHKVRVMPRKGEAQ